MKRLTTVLMIGAVLLFGSAAMAGAPKVDICHIPPGNPGNPQSISVGASAVPAHLAHGDTLGGCGGCQPVSDFCTGSLQPCGPDCACAAALDGSGGACISVAASVPIPCAVTQPCPDGSVCINRGPCFPTGFGFCATLCTAP